MIFYSTLPQNTCNLAESVSKFCAEHEEFFVKRAATLLSIVFSSLSLIPSLKTPASLALRCTALYAASYSEQKTEDSLLLKSLYSTKIAAIAAGIVGVAASSHAFFAASLVADIGFQSIQIYSTHFEPENENSPLSKEGAAFGALFIDVLLLSGICAGSTPLLITASTISTLFMLICTSKEFASIAEAKGDEEKTYDHILNALCYFSLSATGALEVIDMMQPAFYKNKNDEVLL